MPDEAGWTIGYPPESYMLPRINRFWHRCTASGMSLPEKAAMDSTSNRRRCPREWG